MFGKGSREIIINLFIIYIYIHTTCTLSFTLSKFINNIIRILNIIVILLCNLDIY
jgi:hypothetical protein